MSPVLTQQTSSCSSSGISRAVPTCQNQALRSGAPVGSASRGSPIASGSPAGVRRAFPEQAVVPVALPAAVGNARRTGGMDDMDVTVGTVSASPSAATAGAHTPLQLGANALQPAAEAPPAPVAVAFNPVMLRAPLQDDSGLMESSGDIPHDDLAGAGGTTFIPLMRAPPSPAHSSAPCSPASSIVLSGPGRSTYRLTSSSGIDSSTGFAFSTNASAFSPSAGGCGSASAGAVTVAAPDSICPLVNALLGPSDGSRPCIVSEFGAPPSIQPRSALALAPPQLSPKARRQPYQPQQLLLQKDVVAASVPDGYREDDEARGADMVAASAAGADASVGALPPLSIFAAATASGCSSRRAALRDQNSVTIKASTVVKDAAGAIDKILSRGVTALVTALRPGGPPYGTAYDSLNQAVKAIAVARQYAKETGPEGAEVTFLPFHRYDSNERADPYRFAFLVFPVPHLDEHLKTVDETVLNVARGSDVHKMASAIIAVMLDRGQAVMKAAGAEAIFVAMSAVVNARHRLIAKHGFDLMLAAAWITEDTCSTMGRESKFLRFNVLKTEPAGPKSGVAPSLPAMLEA